VSNKKNMKLWRLAGAKYAMGSAVLLLLLYYSLDQGGISGKVRAEVPNRCEADEDFAVKPEDRKPFTWLIAARNDHYGGNPGERLAATLTVLADRLKSYGEEHEVLVVDYNSDTPFIQDCTSPVHRTIRANPDTKISFIVVPPETAKQVSDRPFSEVHALNLGARKAFGRMLIRVDQDTLVNRAFLEWLRKEHVSSEQKHFDRFWWSGRRDTAPEDYEAIVKDPLGYLDKHGHDVKRWGWPDAMDRPENKQCGWGAVGVFAVPREAWHQMCGYDEGMLDWGFMEIEFVNRLETFMECLRLDEAMNAVQPFTHVWHARAGKTSNGLPTQFPRSNPEWGMRSVWATSSLKGEGRQSVTFEKIECFRGMCSERGTSQNLLAKCNDGSSSSRRRNSSSATAAVT